MGTSQCDGTGAVRACGQADTDSCSEWLPSTACSASQVCSTNTCVPAMNCDNPTPNWKKENPTVIPDVQSGQSMVYDVARNKIVMFGGLDNSQERNGTWTWDGNDWKRETPATVPEARYFHAMAFDTLRNKVVMFGGRGNGVYFNDTWTWNGSDWSRESPSHIPDRRYLHAMSDNVTSGKVVMFGGYDGSDRNDIWTWNGSDWTRKSPMHMPDQRSDHAMVYDRSRNNVVMFGGYGIQQFRNDTWMWDGNDWTKETPATIPAARADHAMAFDGGRNLVVVFGGGIATSSTTSRFFNETWTWNAIDWKLETPDTTPAPRARPTMAYDQAHHQLVMFGGSDDVTDFNDTWTLNWTCP